MDFNNIYSVLTDKKDKYGKRIRESRYKLAPTASAYTNFLNNLKECENELREMFDTLVKYMYENLNGFGEIIAADGKAIQSYARRISEKNSGNRGERDANWCQKNYTTTKPDGEKVVKTKKWFGFRLHLLSDITYELPIDYEVTKASNSEVKETEKLLDFIKEKYPEIYHQVEVRLETGWETTIALLEQGMQEGVIRPVRIPILKMMLEASLEQFFQRDILLQNEITYAQALQEVVGILMYGIASER